MRVALWSIATVGAAWLDANGWAVLRISDDVASGAVANRTAISAASQARLRIRLLEVRAGSIRVQRCRAPESSAETSSRPAPPLPGRWSAGSPSPLPGRELANSV